MLPHVRLAFGTILENLLRSPESGRKSSKNRQKRRHRHVYKINTTLHVSISFVRCRRSRVRYCPCSCHLNIKVISPRHRVISSVTFLNETGFPNFVVLICARKIEKLLLTSFLTPICFFKNSTMHDRLKVRKVPKECFSDRDSKGTM